MMVRVEKFHGTGNDFAVVDASAPIADPETFATTICDRSLGISHPRSETVGADGVLFLSLEADGDPPRVGMRLVQPDGSVADMCGNGARCAAAWAAHRTDAAEVIVETDAGQYPATIESTSGDGRSWVVQLEMGPPVFTPADIPTADAEPVRERDIGGLCVTAVRIGVPHAVAFVDDIHTVDLETVAPPVRHAAVFPEGANVTVAAPDGEGYVQRTYERGVEGETDSCGTGAVAVVAVAVSLGRHPAGEPVAVSPVGGTLTVTVSSNSSTLRGPAVRSYETEVQTTDLA